MTVLSIIRDRFRPAIADLRVDPAEYLSLILPISNPKFGDYQANVAMPLAKSQGRSPREVAQDILQRLDLSDICEAPEIAGPGFINLRIRDDAIVSRWQGMLSDTRLGVESTTTPGTFVVDFSSPNIAKPMHVGHIRSTILGDALARQLRFAGHRVVTDNHLGDWGTQFGMIIYGYKHFLNREAYDRQPVPELGRLYQLVRRLMDALDARDRLPRMREHLSRLESQLASWSQVDPQDRENKKQHDRLRQELHSLREDLKETAELAEQLATNPQLSSIVTEHAGIRESVLEETARLHAGDPENRAIWMEVLPACKLEIQRIYQRLGIQFDYELGESFYHDRLADVVDSLTRQGLATESEGARCVFLDGFESPMIVQKRDGAFLYATSDLATIAHRVESWKPDEILYVVDARQSEHFQKLFTAAAKWGYDSVTFRHVSFGTILGSDHRPFKTRSGDTVGLESLLDEAERRAYSIVCEADDKKSDVDRFADDVRRRIATVVGIGAIKYADLSQNRTSDYVFDYDKMLSMQGNTATYLHYSYARVHGIFARGGIDIEQVRQSQTPPQWNTPAERALALRLLQFGEALEDVLVDYRPNLLTNYLYDLAKCFSTFFEECPVLSATTEALKVSRLQLCDLTARTLRLGLALLGIEVVEAM